MVDGDADEHVAGHLRVKPDALHLAHGHAFVAHGGLRLQAADAFAGGELVQVVVGVVAGEPDGQARQQRRDDNDKDACGKGM